MRPKEPDTSLRQRAQSLGLQGLLSHWDQVCTAPWLAELLGWEEQERAQRGQIGRAHV